MENENQNVDLANENKDITTNPDTKPTSKDENKDDAKQPTIQELMVKIAMLDKKANKAASDAAEWKKKYNATLSDKEQLDLAKAEEDAAFKERYAEMEKKLTVSNYRENFMNLGYSKELAEQAANAQFEGDMDTLFAIQQKAMESKEKAIKAELLKSMPVSPISNGENVTKEQFEKMGYEERVNLLNTNPALYKSLTN